ncbi:glycosyltransferase family 90 protein [Aspergillus carbonarius ITEM 5010]|uniref:Glycosyltransferase family 90 protein n=1 Tax=Aspergillus carbonarius (strain ITEM 5010) TaxID=602072 RepID=A0A1R3RS68_ASPC5|nr:glycosyltransferase family 90 protein [Aspergillus carbonarius ITEM 5010]
MVHFSAEMGLKASVGVFLLSCTFISTSYNTTFAFDHPLNSAALACWFAGTSLLILSRFIHRIPKIVSSAPKYSAIPLTERDPPLEEPFSPISLNSNSSLTLTRPRNSARWIKIGLLSVLGGLRIALYRDITAKIECAPDGYAYSIPFFLALYDYWRNQRSQPTQRWTAPEYPQKAHLRAIVTFVSRVHSFLFRSRWRYVIPAFFLLTSGYITTTFGDGLQSTYICPITSGQSARLRAFKILAVILDSLILIGAAELASEGVRSGDNRRKHGLVSWAYSLLGVAVVYTITVIALTASSYDENGFPSTQYLHSAVGQGVLVACVIVSASQLIPYYGIAGLAVLAGFISLYFTWASTLFNGQHPFPLILASRAFAALFFSFIGGLSFLYARTASEEEPQFLYRFNIAVRVIFTILSGIGLILVAQQHSAAHLHPIDLLVYEGRQHHDEWFARANRSQGLADAVRQYRVQYNQHPPPNFDKWYEYAVSRSSLVVDEFDQIYTDLLPFRALPPAQIRELTQKLATNPYNEIGAISIRNGQARVQEGIKPTHAWMVISAAKMIEKFSEYLPDMDLAFNLNDEPRVAVPWEKISVLRQQAKSSGLPSEDSIQTGWSADRGDQWGPIEPVDQTKETLFVDSSFKNIFDRYVGATCPPSSKARSQRIWDRRHLCLSCVRPHSLGGFPSDWAAATDICHQPDLASLHGFFLSPASFKVAQDLTPVFSQSTIAGFNDIIFPSPWNYVDKIEYKPSPEHPDANYTEKANTLFWIGSTSEGTSQHGEWKGMPRQRLTHLVNNNTLNKVSVFLPTNETDTYHYEILDGRVPSDTLHLDTTVNVIDPIVRCRQKDCENQREELGPASRVDFQAHWQHRYLFDSDGAGFSGRFLPFMQSHSLPFKTGLFRQWFDSRITPWLHFVPIDLRLHGLWSTLAYFAGVDSTVSVDGVSRSVTIPPHDIEGEWIAEEGRKWAHRAIRKEDMEIYFFRLLLEWGRITDDQRDLLGYRL